MKLIFGMGTGRCGTHSLTEILKIQKNFSISHEMGGVPFMPWIFDRTLLKKYLSKIKEREQDYCGDVAFWLLPYAESIIKRNPDSKFICIKRDKQQTVNSFLKKTEGRNHWQIHGGETFKLCIWDKCFPKYFAKSKEECLSLYYDNYYEEAQNLEIKYPENVKIFEIDDLNSVDGVKSILSFISIEDQNMEIKTNFKIKARNNK